MKYKVLKFLQTIPKGKVVTYQQIAIYLGNKNLCRVVGNILHNNPQPLVYPCFKVVNSCGKLAKRFGFGGLEGQKNLLIQDGVVVENDKVNLKEYQWRET